MSQQDKDELARRLAAMTDGAAADDPHHAPDQPHEQVDLTSTPPPSPPPPAPPPSPNAPRMIFPDAGGAMPARTTPQPNPFARPAPPPPSIPTPPRQSSARPGAPGEVYYTPPTPLRHAAAPAQVPASAPLDDDAVIVPAPDPTVFAPRPVARPPIQQHRVQTLAFKRTIIPILLTLGVLCPALGLVGFLAPDTSPLSVLRSGWFLVPFILIGLLNLAFAIVTMLQVRDELQRQQRDADAAANPR